MMRDRRMLRMAYKGYPFSRARIYSSLKPLRSLFSSRFFTRIALDLAMYSSEAASSFSRLSLSLAYELGFKQPFKWQPHSSAQVQPPARHVQLPREHDVPQPHFFSFLRILLASATIALTLAALPFNSFSSLRLTAYNCFSLNRRVALRSNFA